MVNLKMGKMEWVLLVWFALTPFFWQMDLSKAVYGPYDFFVMAPHALLHLIVFYFLVLWAVHLNRFSLLSLLLISLYFPFVQLCNYPYLIYRDVYLHAAPAQTILLNGKIAYPKDPAPESWPSSFDLHAVVSSISGIDLINANFLLFLIMILAFTLILYSLATTLRKKGYRLADYSAILFLCLFSNHFFDFNHFSRSTLGFTFLLLFLAVFMRFNGIQGCLLQLLAATAIVTTHPFPSLALVAFAFSYFVLAQRNRQTYFVLFSATFSVGWFLFNGTRTFQDAIDRTKTFFSPQYIAPLAKTVATSENSPWWGVALRDLFKYSLVALLAVASLSTLIILYQKLTHHKNEETSVALSSLLPMAVTILLGLLLLPDWGISRFSAFAAFPAAFASFTLIDDLIMKNWEKRLSGRRFFNKRAFGALLLCGIVALSASVMVLRFERNYYFGEATHPIELYSLSFFFNHDNYSVVNILSWRTTVYSAFFNFNQSHVTLRLWYKDVEGIGGNLSKLLLYEGQFINQSHSVIRGMRDQFDLGLPSNLLNTIDDEMILPRFNRVYSNGNYTIYSRP